MENNKQKPISFWIGMVCLVASVATLFFQRQLGELFGSGIILLWMVLGGVGIYLITKDSDDDQYMS